MTCSGADKINPVSAPLRADVPLHSFLRGRGALGFEKAPPPAHGARAADFGVGQNLSPLLLFFKIRKTLVWFLWGAPKYPLFISLIFGRGENYLQFEFGNGSDSFNFTNLERYFEPLLSCEGVRGNSSRHSWRATLESSQANDAGDRRHWSIPRNHWPLDERGSRGPKLRWVH